MKERGDIISDRGVSVGSVGSGLPIDIKDVSAKDLGTNGANIKNDLEKEKEIIENTKRKAIRGKVNPIDFSYISDLEYKETEYEQVIIVYIIIIIIIYFNPYYIKDV